MQRQWRLRANFLFQKNNSCRCDPLIFWVCSGKWQACSGPCHICGILSLCEVTPAEEVGVQSSDWKGLWWPTSTTCQLFCFVFVAVCWTVHHDEDFSYCTTVCTQSSPTTLVNHILCYIFQANLFQVSISSNIVQAIYFLLHLFEQNSCTNIFSATPVSCIFSHQHSFIYFVLQVCQPLFSCYISPVLVLSCHVPSSDLTKRSSCHNWST